MIIRRMRRSGNIATTNAETVDDYYTKSRLERENMYSQMIEKTNASESQKQSAQKEITKINEQKNAIMIAENLLKNKNFADVIIFINNESINVVVKAKKLETEQVAQVQNIVTREFKANITNIHISTKE